MSTAPDGADRVVDTPLTVPNLITVVRLALIPVYLWVLFSRHAYIGAGVLLGALGMTDFVDGRIARRFNQVSTLGKVLDPAVDRILVVTAVITVTWVGAVPVWFAVLTLAREILVSATVLILAAMGAARIDVVFIGKVGSALMMSAYPWFLIAHGPATWQSWLHVAAWVAGLAGLVCGWIAAFAYVAPARAALAAGRAGRQST